VQETERLALHHRDLRLAREPPRHVVRDETEGVEAWIDGVVRARTASVSSTGESSLRLIRAAHSTAERQTTSSAAIVTTAALYHPDVAADATRMRRDAAGRPAGEQDRHGAR